MKILIAEDDFASRYLLQTLVSKYSSCDVAVNGIEAVELYKMAMDDGNPYDLICLDIQMPEMDGQEALQKIRDIESSYGIDGLDRVKVAMVTAYGDMDNVTSAFDNQCDAYLVKPISVDKIHDVMDQFGFVNNVLKR